MIWPNPLEEALKLTTGDRNESYGHPLDNFRDTAKIWEGILRCPVSPQQVALCMVGVKLAREAANHKQDNLVDMAGYVNTLNMIYERLEEEKCHL